MSTRTLRRLWIPALLLLVAACTALREHLAEPFDPRERYAPLNEQWAPPPLDAALGLSWLVCDSVPSQSNMARVRRTTNSSIPLPQGHRLDVGANSFPGSPATVREFVLVQPRTRHVAVFAHAQKVPMFQKRVRLTIDYGSRGCSVPDPSTMRIVRVDEDGSHEVLNTSVASPTSVYADLDRLSTFAIAH